MISIALRANRSTCVGVMALVLLAGCSTSVQTAAGTFTASQSVSATPVASASPATLASPVSTSPSVSPVVAGSAAPSESSGTSGQVADSGGDAAPGYLDILGLSARADGGQLELSLRLAADLPASSVTVGTVHYDFSLDTNGDGVADRVASLELVPEGGYRPVLIDTATGGRLSGAGFPGAAGLSGSDVTMMVSLDALRCPRNLGIRASSQRTYKGTTIGDDAPDAGAAALAIKTTC